MASYGTAIFPGVGTSITFAGSFPGHAGDPRRHRVQRPEPNAREQPGAFLRRQLVDRGAPVKRRPSVNRSFASPATA